MKTLGLIGGISTHSTAVYYKTLNQLVNDRLGGAHSAKLILHSLDFDEFKMLQEKGDWQQVEIYLTEIALKLENAGADCIVICSNTPHLIADGLRKKINIQLIHIAEETAKEIVKQGVKKVALIGTKFTMEQSFFKDRLSAMGIATIIPDSADREMIHTSIINEFTKGIFLPETRKLYQRIIQQLSAQGAEGVVFGCTEIILLLNQSDCEIKVFDTTEIHSRAAVDFALSFNQNQNK